MCRGTPSIGIITNSGLNYDMKLSHYLLWFQQMAYLCTHILHLSHWDYQPIVSLSKLWNVFQQKEYMIWFVSWCLLHGPLCLKRNIIHKRMNTLQFYIPGFQNHPSYPNQKEFLKSNKGNLKKLNFSSWISTWTALDRARDTFWA